MALKVQQTPSFRHAEMHHQLFTRTEDICLVLIINKLSHINRVGRQKNRGQIIAITKISTPPHHPPPSAVAPSSPAQGLYLVHSCWQT